MTDHRAEAERQSMTKGQWREATLAALQDIAERLPTKGEPCPCGCRRNVEPKPTGVTEPESVTFTLPRDVVERARDRLLTAARWALEDKHLFSAQGHMQAARALSRAIADALEDQS